LTKVRITAAYGWFNCTQHVAPMWTSTYVIHISLGPPAVSNSKRLLDRFSRFCTAHRTVSL